MRNTATHDVSGGGVRVGGVRRQCEGWWREGRGVWGRGSKRRAPPLPPAPTQSAAHVRRLLHGRPRLRHAARCAQVESSCVVTSGGGRHLKASLEGGGRRASLEKRDAGLKEDLLNRKKHAGYFTGKQAGFIFLCVTGCERPGWRAALAARV